MTLIQIQHMLGWCAVINMGILLWWFLFMALAQDWVYSWHTRWIKLSRERFQEIHYQGMLIFKLMLFFFNIVPYLSLHIIR
jgi:hypothetical protein